MVPRLVVLSGYPSVGKSTIAQYMQDNLEFNKLSTDDLREMLYKKEWHQLVQEEIGNLKENLMLDYLNYGKLLLISHNLDTVIDSTAPTREIRNTWLNTLYDNKEFPAEKYLMILKVNKEELLRRELIKRGNTESICIWDRYWEEPETNPVGYKILMYQNENPDGKEAIYADLKKRFGRKDRL